MEVILYTRSGCEISSLIRDLLREKGVSFRECEWAEVQELLDAIPIEVNVSRLPIAVIDGVAIPGNQRAEIEKAIGWVGC